MATWQQTGCVLCAQNCGLLVQIADNRIVKVKGDQENPRSKGYLCRKGANIANFQHNEDRLKVPLKKSGRGFAEISWEQAYEEIGRKLRRNVDDHGPHALAYIGGGGQGCHFEAAFAASLLKGLGSQYHYSPLAQELTGYFWCTGRMLGRQHRFPIPDENGADMLLAIGWNGMVSHQMPRAPLVLKEFARNPDKLLAVIDPRKSETARAADIHLAITPGSDALLARAMIAIILEEGWEDREYLERYTSGLADISPWFASFDAKKALAVCGVDYQQVKDLCRELGTRKWCMHTDLGVIMNRHSTLASYLYLLLSAVCGRLCVSGGNVIPGSVVPLGGHSDEREPGTWRTRETDFPAIMGFFPPNVFAEEVLADRPDRLRAAIVSSANPLRSYADTGQWEKAFAGLELSVTIDINMTETCALSDYVLPARSAYESYDGSFFSWNFPEVYFQLRHPLIRPEPQTRETGLILAGIADKAGLIPEFPDYLVNAAQKDRLSFTAALLAYMGKNPKQRRIIFPIIAKLRSGYTESGNLDALWALLLSSPPGFRKNAARAGFPIPSLWESAASMKNLATALYSALRSRSMLPFTILSPQVAHSRLMFETIVNGRSGLWIGTADGDNMKALKTGDRKIALHIPEMEEWLTEITAEAEAESLTPDPAYPFILNAGRHAPTNANTLMRKPDWNAGRRPCTLAMNPADAERLHLVDGEMVRITTESASETIELEITADVREGQVLIPHGFGLNYNGELHGVNVNRLTRNSHRDRLAATPIHRYVACRVEKLDVQQT